MELRQLKSFVTVADVRSFTKAAEILDYAQSSVTSQVASLERELGTRLFERLGRQVALTKDGYRLLAYAEKILKLSSEAREAVSGSLTPKGTLSICAPETLCAFRLPLLIQEYRRRYTGVEIVLKRCARQELLRLLKSNVIDVAFFMGREIIVPDLVSEILIFERMTVVAGAGHQIIDRIPITPRDIEGESLILCEAGCSYREDFEVILKEAGVKAGSVMEFSSVEAIKKCVVSGLGISLLPHVAVEEELNLGRLVDLCWQGPDFDINTQIVYHKDKWISPAISALLDLSREMQRPAEG